MMTSSSGIRDPGSGSDRPTGSPATRIPDPGHGSRLERQAPDRRRLPREPQMAQAVRPVRGDFEVNHRLAALFDAGDFESAQADLAAAVSTSTETGTSSRSQL